MKNSKDTKEDSKMTRIFSIVFVVLLLAGLGFVVSGNPKSSNSNETVQNVEIKDGVQYVTITAKGGYTPRVSEAKAGIPTKLLVNTKDTFDCSASLVIPTLNYQKLLPQNSETEIDIGVHKIGEKLQGLCSMGMYNFEINFI